MTIENEAWKGYIAKLDFADFQDLSIEKLVNIGWKGCADIKDKEIADLTNQRNYWQDKAGKFAQDEFLALEKLTVLGIEIESAYVLLTEYNKWDIECKEKIADLTAQNAKLREALEQVLTTRYIVEARYFADNALASTKELNK